MKPSAPKPPDPVKTAAAQARLNREAAYDSARLNQINQWTPWGGSYWTGEIGDPNRTQHTVYNPTVGRILFGDTYHPHFGGSGGMGGFSDLGRTLPAGAENLLGGGGVSEEEKRRREEMQNFGGPDGAGYGYGFGPDGQPAMDDGTPVADYTMFADPLAAVFSHGLRGLQADLGLGGPLSDASIADAAAADAAANAQAAAAMEADFGIGLDAFGGAGGDGSGGDADFGGFGTGDAGASAAADFGGFGVGDFGGADAGGADGGGGGGDGGDGGCFLTTAATQMGEADDGPTLSTLRQFRDGYMREDPARREMVDHYYQVAPKIAKAIPKGSPEWNAIGQTVQQIKGMIEAGRSEEAMQAYSDMMEGLSSRYLQGTGSSGPDPTYDGEALVMAMSDDRLPMPMTTVPGGPGLEQLLAAGAM